MLKLSIAISIVYQHYSFFVKFIVVIPGQHSSTSYPGQTVNSPGIPPYGHPMMNPSHPDPYYRMADTRHESNTTTATNENDFPEILEQNKTISSSAINSAVHYASQGRHSFIRFRVFFKI